MLQTKLILRADISKYKQISETVFDEVLNGFIVQSQIQDIAPLLGEMLFNDLMKTPGNYTDLLNGGSYTVDSVTYENYGLKAVLSHYTYARYVMFGSAIDTPFSLVRKLNQGNSEPVSDSHRKTIWQMNRDDAFTLWQSVENYLRRTNNSLFLGNNECDKQSERGNHYFNLSKIG